MATPVMQVAYATQDIEKTARSLALIERVGPFFRAEFPLENLTYRGRRVHYGPLRVAFGYKGDLQYELIQVPKGEPSCYSELLGDRHEGLHHTYQTSEEEYDEIVARYAAAGEPMVYGGIAGSYGVRFGFIDATARLGHFIEILETRKIVGPGELIFTLYDRIRALASQWDGKRPVRLLDELMDS